MGSYDGAEVCIPVGLYSLSTLQYICSRMSMHQYWELWIKWVPDGPILIAYNLTLSGESLGYHHTINMKVVYYLDVTLNLRTERCYPYRKESNLPWYNHKDSSHMPAIIKQLPNMIASQISKCQGTLIKVKASYQEALQNVDSMMA